MNPQAAVSAVPAPRNVILANVRAWQRSQRNRKVAKERRTFSSHFNSVADAIPQTKNKP